VATAAPADDVYETVITYYFVVENLAALAAAEGAGLLYVVFVKNQLWPRDNRPPFVPRLPSVGTF
jgi:hypothetical protein